MKNSEWKKVCAACAEGTPPERCAYYGDPNGCNAPTLGKHPEGNLAERLQEALEKAERRIAKLERSPGNAAAMRDALEESRKFLLTNKHGYFESRLIPQIEAALAAPPESSSNAAALREALENARSKFIHIKKCVDEGEVSRKKTAILCEFVSQEIAAALSSPARNCDRYATAKDALDAFIREKEIKAADVDNMNLRDFFYWLFAPANGGAKCVNGLRGEPDCRGCNEHCEDVRKRNCFYWNPDIEGGVCSLTGKKSCPISCDNFHIPEKVSPPPAEGGAK